MPNLYEYSLQFFDRYYRPEYTTIVVVGDVQAGPVKQMVEKHWGDWKRGKFKPEIPAEPPQEAPRTQQISWPTPTLPLLAVAYKGPAYTDEAKDSAALDVLSFLGFSETSDLYQRLVVTEQKVDQLFVSFPDHADPFLFSVVARVKEGKDLDYVREQILATVNRFVETPVDKKRLEEVKQHLRYRFSLGMDNSASIAETLAHYIALRRTPETINKIYALYSQITPEDIQAAARTYLKENNRSMVTLKGVEE
jgi:zinc protease